MNFRLDFSVEITEELVQCAIAELLCHNHLARRVDLVTGKPLFSHITERAISDKNIIGEIKKRVSLQGYDGLDNWYDMQGFTFLEDAKEHLDSFSHLID